MAEDTTIRDKTAFESYLQSQTSTSVIEGWKKRNPYYPVEGNPIVEVVDEKNNSSFYALWRKRDKEGGEFDKFALVSLMQLSQMGTKKGSFDPPNDPVASPQSVVKYGWSKGSVFQETEAVEVTYNPVTQKQVDPKFAYWSKTGEMTADDTASFARKKGYTFDSNGNVHHPEKGELRIMPTAIVDKKALEAAQGNLTPEVLATDLSSQGYTYGPVRKPISADISVDESKARAAERDFLGAVRQSSLLIMQATKGQKEAKIVLRQSDLDKIENISIEETPTERQFREMRLKRSSSAAPHPVSPTILTENFNTAAPVSAIKVVADISTSAKSLAERGVLADKDAAYQQNHDAARKALKAIRDNSLSDADIAVVAQSFRSANLAPFADVIARKGTSDELHEAHKKLAAANRDDRASRRSVSPEDAIARAQRGVNDPANMAEAQRRANEALAGIGVTPQVIAEGKILQALMTDTKTEEEKQRRLPNIKAQTGIDVTKLPPDTQQFILQKMQEAVMARKDEILKLYDPQNPEAARKKLVDISEEAIIKALKEIKPTKTSELSPSDTGSSHVENVASLETTDSAPEIIHIHRPLKAPVI